MCDLGKPVKCKQEDLDLKVKLEKILDTLKPLGIVKYCRVVWDVETPLPKVRGDCVQLDQAFRNLIVNATQAMEEAIIHDKT